MTDFRVLPSKLLVPPLRPGWVERPGLLRRLDEGLTRKLTLVCAPAGYGKTTLLAGWLHRVDCPVAWVSVEESDNDPTRFIAAFDAAIHRINPHHDPRSDPAQARYEPAGATLETVQAALLQELYEVAGDFVIVLDDFHLVTSPVVHNFVTFLLDHWPPQAHLVIATRADPPLPLPRLRARGQMTELRLNQMRFSPSEAGEFLRHAGGLELGEAEVAALTERTEGWAAGLQMAALALQGLGEDANLAYHVRTFAGSHRYVLDYLIEEVLQNQPPEVQSFLLYTSILDRFNASLCEEVTRGEVTSNELLSQRGEEVTRDEVSGQRGEEGTSDELLSHQVKQEAPLFPHHSVTNHLSTNHSLTHNASTSHTLLLKLDHANLFIIPLDDRREWYRYHHLFAGLLRKQLQQTDPQRIPELHRRASGWFARHSMDAEAIHHALAAGDIEQAVRLVENAAERTLMRGETATVMNWLNELPSAILNAHPRLRLYRLTGHVLLGQPRENLANELHALAAVDLPGPISLRGEVHVLEAFLAVLQAHIGEADALARRAQTELLDDAVYFRSLAAWVIEHNQVKKSDMGRRAEILTAMLEKPETRQNLMLWIDVTSNLAEVYSRQGKLPKTRELYQSAIDIAIDADGRPLPAAGTPMIGLAHLLCEWNEPAKALQLAEQGIELVRQVRQFGVVEGLVTVAFCKQALGEPAAARQAIADARQVAITATSREVGEYMMDFYEAMLLDKLGDPLSFSRYFEQKAARQAQPPPEVTQAGGYPKTDETLAASFVKYEQVAWARACLEQGQADQALVTLNEMLPEVEKQGRVSMTIEVELLRALALARLEQPSSAQSAFERALLAAEPGGWVRQFIDEGEVITLFLEQAAARGVCDGYARRLLDGLRSNLLKKSPAGEPRLESGIVLAGDQTEAHSPIHATLSNQVESPRLINAVHPADALSQRELEVLRLLAGPLSAREIAERLLVAESTLNSHIKSIYSKLSAHRRTEAVEKARALKLIAN